MIDWLPPDIGLEICEICEILRNKNNIVWMVKPMAVWKELILATNVNLSTPYIKYISNSTYPTTPVMD